jgi:hypothetical protein
MRTFDLITNIDPENENSWRDKIFLTIDIDWAPDFVLEQTYDLFNKAKIPATWFITHDTPFNNKLFSNSLFATGIHPNFNPLLQGSPNSADSILNEMKTLVPGAVTVRSHSLTQSSVLLNLFAEKGFRFDLNTFIPMHSWISVRPVQHWGGVWQLPHVWEDDIHCYYNLTYPDVLKQIREYQGLLILDFHPIHLFLNTEKFSRYFSVKNNMSDMELLRKNICDSYGTRNFFSELISIYPVS